MNTQTLIRWVAVLGCWLHHFSATASVESVSWYRLGENEPGAIEGSAATVAVDFLGRADLQWSGSPVFSAEVAAEASLHVASVRSVRLRAGDVATGAGLDDLDNWGVEAWVQFASISGNSVIAYNGNTALNGWGLIRVGDNLQGLFGGVAFVGSRTVVTDVWYHVALVRDGGVATLYVNGEVAGLSSAGLRAPQSGFALGAQPQNPAAELLDGWLDEVRVFRFSPGEFRKEDLLWNRTLAVTSDVDGQPGSLRAQIQAAFPGDTIYLPGPGVSVLTNEIDLTKNLQLVGTNPDRSIISGQGSNRLFTVAAGVTSSLSGLVLRDGLGRESFGGSAIGNRGTLVISNCVLESNRAGTGADGVLSNPANSVPIPNPGDPGPTDAALANQGELTVLACTFRGNIGGTGGAGVKPVLIGTPSSGGPGGQGAALFNSGHALVRGSTFVGNTGGTGGPGVKGALSPGSGGTGGASAAVYNTGELTLTLCTIDGNFVGLGGVVGNTSGTRSPSGNTGCIYNSGLIRLISCTVTRNEGGGVHNLWFATARGSLFAWNGGASGAEFDFYGPFSSLGNNLIRNDTGSFGFFPGRNQDQVGTAAKPLDPLIGPLSDNGGLTQTVPLLPGSPALDSSDDALVTEGVTVDQRGNPRRSGSHVDIGAYELAVGSAPRIRTEGLSADGRVNFTFTNVPQGAFTVLSSAGTTDSLGNWKVVGPVSEISPGLYFFQAPKESGKRFFSVRSP